MKKNLLITLLLVMVTTQYSCKKFLDVVPIEKLSGNQFWQNSNDVEAFVNDIYGQLWDKLSGASFIPAAGEQRLSEIKPNISGRFNSSDASRRSVYTNLATNDMKNVIASGKSWSGVSTSNSGFGTVTNMNFVSITKWAEFYTVIQASNIMYRQVSSGIPGLSSNDKNKYLAEAVYIRCLAYFLIVRLFGDVPYYTDAYHSTPIARENFVSVLNKCIAELKPVKDALPWVYADPIFNGIRANKGGAISLLMNMNMWNAGFDAGNKSRYYQETVDLGNELIRSNQYQLLPLGSFNILMQAGTSEGLIEIKQGLNYASTFNKVAFPGEPFLAFPDKTQTDGNGLYSHASYTAAYMHKLWDADPTDKRISSWFTNIYSQDGLFELKKFAGSIAPQGFPDWGLIISRYADVILLTAEASAELGNNDNAILNLNMIRQRAGALPYNTTTDLNLKDAIFLERCKEFIGEGYHYYDLVRTGRITDSNWCTNALTTSQFANGAWTWPIDLSAKTQNPYIVLNQYWQ